jgi:hypothetical protein
MMEERKIKPDDFRLEDLDRGIIVREDELEYELFKLHLYEDEAQKAEAATGSEVESVETVDEGKKVEKFGKKYQPTHVIYAPKALLARPREYAIEERIKSAEERKREILRELQKPPSFGDSKVYRVPNGDYYVIELQFERLGRNRRLEIKTSSLDANFIGSLPEELSIACRGIPHNEFVIPHILEHIKRLMENPVCPRLICEQ